MFLARVGSVVFKEVRQIARDPKMMVIILIAPVIQLLLYGYAATFDLANVPVVVLDRGAPPGEDGVGAPPTGLEAARVLRALEASGEFRIVGRVAREAEVERWLMTGRAKVAMILPRDFDARVRAGDGRARVGVWLDGSDSNTATIARASVEQVLAHHATRLRVEALRRADPGLASRLDALSTDTGVPAALDVRTRILYNPELRSASFMVPGVVVIVLLIMTTMLSALSMVKEKEIGTFEMLLATPIRPVELVVGKLLPFVAIGFLDVCLIVSAAVFWFEVPIRGSVPLIFGFSAVFLLASIGLGLLLSTLVSTQRQAMVLAFVMMFPMVLLSGFIFPIDGMPTSFQVASQALPVRHFLEAVRAIFLRGVGLEILLPKLAALAGLGVTILTLAVVRFKKQG